MLHTHIDVQVNVRVTHQCPGFRCENCHQVRAPSTRLRCTECGIICCEYCYEILNGDGEILCTACYENAE